MPFNTESAMKTSKVWCDFHKTATHSTEDCWTLKRKEKEKNKKKRKWLLKKEEKAHKTNSGSSKSESSLSELEDAKASTAKKGHTTTECVHVSREPMKYIQAYLAVQPSDKVSNDVLINSSTSSHMTPQLGWFIPSTYKTIYPPVRIHLGNDSVIDGIGTGSVQFEQYSQDGKLKTFIIFMHQLYY